MSIATRTGDDGTTGLLFGDRVSKSSATISAIGDIDEASAAMGVAKASLKKRWTSEPFGSQRATHLDDAIAALSNIQQVLWHVMGELNCRSREELDEYSSKFTPVTDANLKHLDDEIERLESILPKQTGWLLYGDGSTTSSYLYLASKIVRRAERSMCTLPILRTVTVKYTNRLSDLLHLMARIAT
jgi:cob(I)alamin adenosyltransferase